MYKVGSYFVWKKRLFLIEKYFSELMWIYDVDIIYKNSCVVISGIDDDVMSCICCIEGLLLGWKGGENV